MEEGELLYGRVFVLAGHRASFFGGARTGTGARAPPYTGLGFGPLPRRFESRLRELSL